MNPWPFVIGAYAAAFVGVAGLFAQSYFAVRKAERDAAELRRK